MLKLKAIHKQRKVFLRVIIYALTISLIFIIVSFFIEDQLASYHIWPSIRLVLIGTFASLSIFLTFLNWFPIIKNHKELGTITFEKDAIIRTAFGKEEIYAVAELSELKFTISGHHGEDISMFPRINTANGTGNFVTLKSSKYPIKKIEFYLDSERELNTLHRYIDHYGTQTDVRNG